MLQTALLTSRIGRIGLLTFLNISRTNDYVLKTEKFYGAYQILRQLIQFFRYIIPYYRYNTIILV